MDRMKFYTAKKIDEEIDALNSEEFRTALKNVIYSVGNYDTKLQDKINAAIDERIEELKEEFNAI
jgi:hypothetical protein